MFSAGLILLCLRMGGELPEHRITADNAVIEQSCRIVIPPNTIIEDNDGDGVIHIRASNIVVEFAPGSELRGARPGTAPDQYRGCGIRVFDQQNVTIRGARISGFWTGIHATRADYLVLDGIDASDQRRARLLSTPAAEDAGDWLWPHKNDDQEWRKNYGAAICIEQSRAAAIRNCRVRDSQNGLILDRVAGTDVSSNEFSFLSGWGIAMWRSSGNKLMNNAVDFCVRGYSHGVYNRGQDSAGFLVFEQCSDNTFQYNSATHCGDGLFMFAGREALGEATAPTPNFDYKRRGCNDNMIANNDFSYAAAHGVEVTFSFSNVVMGNRIVGNAICGIWGGYSQETEINDNTIAENGEGAYGLERGGVNIEHGRRNGIFTNRFERNKCGVHLWWDADESILKLPWAVANGVESTANEIGENEFHSDDLALHFRGRGDVVLWKNLFVEVGAERKIEGDVSISPGPEVKAPPRVVPVGRLHLQRPIGQHSALAGRQNIIMTEWGPWDHQSPLVRRVGGEHASHVYELRKFSANLKLALSGENVELDPGPKQDEAGENAAPRTITVRARGDGAFPYVLTLDDGGVRREIRDTLVVARWSAIFLATPTDPRNDARQFAEVARQAAEIVPDDTKNADASPTSRAVVPIACVRSLPALRLKFGHGGPESIVPNWDGPKIGGDHFGMLATTRIPLSKGKWKITTMSDDGVRVTVDDKRIIDNWTWHVPTRDEATIDLEMDRTVEIAVEYFELDGFAVLEFDIARQN
ncbi:MAG: right-handed parallel beta-helix repeat-containing protein [Phycisphaerales bacterium]|nr:right-handed parallel beta-helix repeat-containing protein [Phycisphaerales bacterium]